MPLAFSTMSPSTTYPPFEYLLLVPGSKRSGSAAKSGR